MQWNANFYLMICRKYFVVPSEFEVWKTLSVKLYNHHHHQVWKNLACSKNPHCMPKRVQNLEINYLTWLRNCNIQNFNGMLLMKINQTACCSQNLASQPPPPSPRPSDVQHVWLTRCSENMVPNCFVRNHRRVARQGRFNIRIERTAVNRKQDIRRAGKCVYVNC